MEKFKSDLKYFWTVVGFSTLLAVVSGFINVVCLWGFSRGDVVTHVTGTVTKLGIYSLHDFDLLPNLIMLIFFFWFGSFCCGLIIGDAKFQLQNKYGLVMMIISMTLLITYWLFLFTDIGGNAKYILAWVSGLQNAMCTSFSGAIIRTTHMTGLCTDLGIISALVVRNKGKHDDAWKLGFLLPLLLGYYFGCMLAAGTFPKMGVHAMVLPIAATGITGCSYFLYQIQVLNKQMGWSFTLGPVPTNEEDDNTTVGGTSTTLAQQVELSKHQT